MQCENKVCGIIMPISAIDGCDESHWREVKDILHEAIGFVGFEANLVSDADDSGIIHKTIIQNLYDNPVVICDVSGKNPNVMFELGLRLAFDKPTIIIKDDRTTYSFDTAPIEHIEYPRDLRFSRIVEFKKKLSEKIKTTYDKSMSDKNYSSFLKSFGEFKVAKIDEKEMSGQEYLLDEVRDLSRMSALIKRELNSIREIVLMNRIQLQQSSAFDMYNSRLFGNAVTDKLSVKDRLGVEPRRMRSIDDDVFKNRPNRPKDSSER